MSLLSTVGTILPTVGTILGQLLTSGFKTENGERVVPFNFGGEVSGGFLRENDGTIKICNSEISSNKHVVFSVPTMGELLAQNIIVPARQEVDITDIFKDAAEYDSSQLIVSGSAHTDSNDNNSPRTFHYATGGRNIPVDGVTRTHIGSFLTVVCSQNGAVFTSRKRMVNINSVIFYGNNDTEISLGDISPVLEPTTSGSSATIKFPMKLPKGIYLNVDVEIDMQDPQGIYEEQCKEYKYKEMSESQRISIHNLALGIHK
jgi:hypothetical protein